MRGVGGVVTPLAHLRKGGSCTPTSHRQLGHDLRACQSLPAVRHGPAQHHRRDRRNAPDCRGASRIDRGRSSRHWTDTPSLQFEFNEIDRGDAGVAYRTCCIRFLPNKLAEFEVNSWSGCPGSLSTIVPPLRTILMPGAFWVKAATDWPGSSTNRQPRSRSLSRTGLYSGTSERADAENRRNGVLTTTAAPSDWPDHLYTSGVDSSLMVAGDG